jgi:hypothetical protein
VGLEVEERDGVGVGRSMSHGQKELMTLMTPTVLTLWTSKTLAELVLSVRDSGGMKLCVELVDGPCY